MPRRTLFDIERDYRRTREKAFAWEALTHCEQPADIPDWLFNYLLTSAAAEMIAQDAVPRANKKVEAAERRPRALDPLSQLLARVLVTFYRESGKLPCLTTVISKLWHFDVSQHGGHEIVHEIIGSPRLPETARYIEWQHDDSIHHTSFKAIRERCRHLIEKKHIIEDFADEAVNLPNEDESCDTNYVRRLAKQ